MIDPTAPLIAKQKHFARMVARLLDHADSLGFEVTLGDAYRDPRAFGIVGKQRSYGNPASAHKLRLAIDLNLFRDGHYLTKTSDHLPLGLWWESQGGTWGGRFDDGNHYSIPHDGTR